MTASSPELRFVIPAANENRWSDLLATLIATDPAPMVDLIGVEFDEVQREAVVPSQIARRSDRLDLRLLRDHRTVAAIEVKLLSDLGAKQLDRYLAASRVLRPTESCTSNGCQSTFVMLHPGVR